VNLRRKATRARKPMAVFLSHATADVALAARFKLWVKNTLLGRVETIVSGDGEDVAADQQWLDRISTDLRRSELVILLCTPATVNRFWTSFEAGGAFFLKKPIIPLCARGTDFNQLPIPLQLRHGYCAWDAKQLRMLIARIAKAAELECPPLKEEDIEALAREFGDSQPGGKSVMWIGEKTVEDDALLSQIEHRHGPLTHLKDATATKLVEKAPSSLILRLRGSESPPTIVEHIRAKLPTAQIIIYADGVWVARHGDVRSDACVTIEARGVLRALDQRPAAGRQPR